MKKTGILKALSALIKCASLQHKSVLQNGKVREGERSILQMSTLKDNIRDISMLSQAITLVESSLREHYELAQQIIEKCLPYSTKSVRIGITGVPGAGKSTFIEALGLRLADQGRRVAVLAIDPSSTNTRGSILGDKTRMEKLGTHPNALSVRLLPEPWRSCAKDQGDNCFMRSSRF